MNFISICVFIFLFVLSCVVSQPYANDFPYQKYGYKSEEAAAENDLQRYMKKNSRDRDDLMKVNADTGISYNLDSNKNEHDSKQVKKGSATDNLTHVQGEDFETDKSHKRKHIKSGFQNSYHKDENGSRSSYYEDSDDTGGKVIYDKRHGTRGDNQETQFAEGLKNGVARDRYDDRRTGYDSRDLIDQQRWRVEDQGKQHGYLDNYKAGLDDRFEVVRRPYSDLQRHHRDGPLNSRIRDLDDYDRSPANQWGYNNRLPPAPSAHDHHSLNSYDRSSSLNDRSSSLHDHSPSAARDFQTRRRITIYEDPRDELVDSKVDRFRDNGNYMTRSEITRRFDYGPSDRTPMRTRYRGL